MKPIVFTYRGKHFKGFIEANTQEYPHFYWFFLDDAELIEEAGDCLSFKMYDDGELNPSEFNPKEHQELVNILKDNVQQYIQGSQAT